MKKLFSLLTLALLTMSAWAATEVTIDFSELYTANQLLEDASPITVGDVNLSFAKADGTNAPQYYANGSAARIYAGNTMTVASEKAITNIAFTYSQGAWTSACVSEGAYADGVWAGNANSVVFTNSTGGQVRIKSMVVTLADAGEPVVTVDAPVFDPAGQDFLTESLDVTLTCATEGAAIKYSTDGLAWSDYTGPITITETTTIYAKAVLGDVESLVVNATYTKVASSQVVTFALVTDVAELADGDKIIIVSSGAAGSAYALAASRGNNFGAVEVTIESNLTISTYDANIITLEANGDNWNLKTADGYIYAASSSSNQMKLEDAVDADGNANAAITIANDTTKIIFQGTNTRNHMRFNSGNNPVIFSCYAESSSVKNPVYIFKATTDVPEPPVDEVEAPVFNPTSCVFTGTQQVTLTCATEGATIYYAINDGEYQEYTAAFTLDETATVKAYAKVGDVQSAEVTATYTKRVQVYDIATANALGNKVDFVFYGNAVVTYQNGKNLWVRDDSGSGLIYGSQVPALEQGTILEAGWEAQKYDFRGGLVPEFQYPNEVASSGETATVEPFVRETIALSNVNEYVIMKGLSIIAETDTTVSNYQKYFYNAADSLVLFNQFGIEFTLEEGKTYDVVGVVTVYNEKPQLYIISVTEAAAPAGMRGDVDLDGEVGVSDITALLDAIVTGNWEGRSISNADCDLDSEPGINDVTALLNYLLTGNWN